MTDAIELREQIESSKAIEWSKNYYDPNNGDQIKRELGVISIFTDSRAYELKETQDGKPHLTERAVQGTERSKIYVGYLANTSFKIVVNSKLENPFNLADPDRINQAAVCVKKASELDKSYNTSQRISKESLMYLQDLRSIIPEADEKALRSIAVLQEELTKYLKVDYPIRFLELADEFDRLGIDEVRFMNTEMPKAGQRNEPEFTMKVEWLRDSFSPKLENQQATSK
jgi:hypothetical protein